jgi:rfaE bifunctional protein kinase chain/domain
MKPERVIAVLKEIQKVKVAVYGDFCLDAYWIMDPHGSEISLETGLKAEAVRQHYYSPGGASNIVANLVALNPAEILTIGVIGDDVYGRELNAQLEVLHVNTSLLLTQKENFDTYTFTKKITHDEEGPRIDFGTYNKRSKNTDERLLEGIEHALENFDILIFNQQVPGSITNDTFIESANTLFSENSDKIVLLDSRHYNKRFESVSRKVNDIELERLAGIAVSTLEDITLDKVNLYAQKIFQDKPIFVTCGEKGIITMDVRGVHHAPGLQLLTKLDTVGAGDTTISALACCLAAGILPEEAAAFANFAAAVTVQKLFTTGTANGEEILNISNDPDYVYNPDLANHSQNAVYFKGSNVEICNHEIVSITKNIKHIVFDHDGTLSTLRRGWEVVMREFMIESIIGEENPDKRLMVKIEKRVMDYIELSTGVQTIVQMEILGSLVREFKLMPQEKVLDKFGYKNLYIKRLLQIVNERLSIIKQDASYKDLFIIKGTQAFLEELHMQGIKLYLASGTDEKDVKYEASILGYADLFEGRIYGSVDDIHKYSKKLVIDSIVAKNKLKNHEFAVVGDGPVEIREGRKQHGLAIGIASDENTGHGLNYEKRSRLINAGADIIISNYSEPDILLNLILG